jgi:antitoxin MazE
MRTYVQRWGNSLALRIPKGFAADADLSEGAEVDMRVERRKLVVARRAPSYRLSELLDRVTARNRHAELSTGQPVGREIW